MLPEHPSYRLLRHPFAFTRQVLQRFQANQGTLLAGAIAYNALLSLIPLLILLLVALSQVVNEAQLLTMLHRYLEQLIPGSSDFLLEHVEQFLGHRKALGWTMAGTLLFFSAAAFGVLENAMAVIFTHRRCVYARRMIISLLLPYLYVLLLGCGLLAVTLLNGVLQMLATVDIQVLGWTWSPSDLLINLLYMIGLLGQVLGLTLIYMLMPAGRLPWRHALLGGIAATLLWEATRYALIWYFANLSKIGAIYGSLAGVIVVLMTLYAISLIILLGAQVIAEYERQTPEFRDAAIKQRADHPMETPESSFQ
ncbi:MAG: YihY/virulence factor BrkB family protein [Gammaproteobacteria bacterium]|nr:YihY/virulence factor BrkB family protein [Gammaproteobacteria bacterium]MCP5197750.1 YihY/virulence factor BrkB family protein [Gammaproteobacteria bacterium]